MQEASSSTVHHPLLNHTCAPVCRGTERNFLATAEISISPPPLSHQKPHFHCSSLLSKFKPSLLLTGSSSSSPATLLLVSPPPRWRPFLLCGHLAADPSSHCAASSIWSGNPHPAHTSSSFPVPHAPTDGATPSTKITDPLLQLSAPHSHFTRSITWS